ncbi:MAG: thioredoxin, partial [Actinomycetes bacterium]
MGTAAPLLPDGIVIVVKKECATCQLVEPLLARIKSVAGPLTVWTQDDPSFASSVGAVHDSDLAVSWHHGIETVP